MITLNKYCGRINCRTEIPHEHQPNRDFANVDWLYITSGFVVAAILLIALLFHHYLHTL